MPNEDVKSVYDKMGDDYRSDEHESIRLSNDVQRIPIIRSVRRQTRRLGKAMEELDVLNIGVGSGQNRSDLCIYSLAFCGERVSDYKLTDFDISDRMRYAAMKLIPNTMSLARTKGFERYATSIRGDATCLSNHFEENMFDVVLAGLCDGINPQEKMYREVFKVLRKGGIFIVTYPHKDVATVIRTKLYKIDPKYTRYIIDGKKYILRSFAATPNDITRLFKKTGYIVPPYIPTPEDLFCFYRNREPSMTDWGYSWTLTVNDAHSTKVSKTFMKAWKRMKVKVPYLGDLPVLVFGEGAKPYTN
jgi:SAM-dependent methyltransferase